MNFGIVCYDEVKYLLQKQEPSDLSETALCFIDFVSTVRIYECRIPALLIQQVPLTCRWQNNPDKFSF